MKNDRKSLCPEFEKHTSQELEEMLRTELEREQPNRETVLQLLDVLETRATGASAGSEASILVRQQRKQAGRWLRGMIIAASIVLAFVFVAPPVFGAENVVELVGRWTQDLFAIFREGEPNTLQAEYVFRTDHPGLQQLYDAATEKGITQRVVPTWLPDGCELESPMCIDVYDDVYIHAYFYDDDRHMLIMLKPSSGELINKYPKDDINAVLYEIEGIKHYVVQNESIWSAVWINEGIECTISTNYGVEMLKKVLFSIYR